MPKGVKSKKKVIDFTNDPYPTGGPEKKELQKTKKQIRTRARRHGKIAASEFELLYKPLDMWDEEELARGRPRAIDGSFRGRAPNWITREMHEEAMSRFKHIVEGRMRGETVGALDMIHQIITSEDEDDKGKPIVAASTKLDAAKFLIEHVLGKPKQRQEVDISVRLQGLLAVATAGPVNGGAAELAAGEVTSYADAFGGLEGAPDDPDAVIDGDAWEDDDDEDDDE